jgi:serine/threonine protein kinase/Tol biopolymer transport system component
VNLPGGTRLGPYEIVAAVGAGGMGEVYRAKDTRLDRTVAVKVLPAHLSSSVESRQRFEREAKTISQLSHPHICALYDVGNQDGVEFLVMEYLEGETLSDRLAKGPLAFDQVLRYGIEIADALDKAHRQGIVHRDLKPGNVMITKSGVKLLDFGLAKAVAPMTPQQLTSFPTQQALTQEGTILGTFQYMAPEQLEGKEADARTDIFAFGCVLYEMATGKKAFSGKSQASLISSIMASEPPAVSMVAPMTPPAFDRVVRTCLAKDPDDRWQTAHDIALQLKWVAEGSSAGIVGRPAAPRRERLAWGAFAVAAIAALVLGVLVARQKREPPRSFRSSILPPENTRFEFRTSPMVISPDGRQVAFVAQPPQGARQLWLRPFDTPQARPLAGTDGALKPFWSPDSRSLGFFAGGKLKKIDVSGGSPQTLCDAPSGRGGTWNRDGVILFVPTTGDRVHRVAASGGAASPVTRLDASKGEFGHTWPFFLPDGRHFLYVGYGAKAGRPEEASSVYLASLDSKERRLLFHARSNVAFAPLSAGTSQGHLLFWQEGALLARPFDAKRLRFTGEAFPVAEQVRFLGAGGTAIYSVSENGVLAYQSSPRGELSQLTWFDRSGKQLESVGPAADCSHPRLSHDGHRLAVVVGDPQTAWTDIWIYDLGRRVSTRLTFGPGVNLCPVWSPDDQWIAFSSNRKGFHDIYRKAASGTGPDELLFASDGSKFPTDWSGETGLIAFPNTRPESKTGSDIWLLSVAERKARPFLATPFHEGTPQFSPDGRWMAYASAESGTMEVFVQAFPASGGKWQISTAGGSYPRWRRDGKELYYIAPGDTLMAVDVKAGSGFTAGAPKPLFRTRIKSLDIFFQYDVSPDGQRFLVNTLPEGEQRDEITVVQNWTSDLKK